MKAMISTLAVLLTAGAALAADSVIGFWKTIDDETHEVKSIVQIYEYQGKVYGRVVDIMKNPDAKAKLPGSPAIKGLDIIWDLQKDGDQYTGGEVLDPQKGKTYDCRIWLKDSKTLIVRGSLLGIGRKQEWKAADDYKGSTAAPTPKKPKLK